MTNDYARAYTEVLEILKFLPKEEYNKIPSDKIAFYEKYKDNNYDYKFDITKSLEEQKISKETNAIIVTLFRDFFATQIQKEKLEIILKQNEKENQEELRRKYNPDNVFHNNIANVEFNSNNSVTNETSMCEYKNSFFDKIKKWFKRLFYNKNYRNKS